MKLKLKNKSDRRDFGVVEEIRKRVAGYDTEPELNETLNRVERKTTLFLILIFLVGVLIAAAVILYFFLKPPDPPDPDDGNTTGTVRPVNDLCMNAIDLSESFDTNPPGRGYGGFYLAPINGTTVGATPDEDCRGFKNAKGVWYVLDNHWYDHVHACDAFDGARVSVFSGWSCSTLACISEVSGNGLTCSVEVPYQYPHHSIKIYVLVHGETDAAVGDFHLDMDYYIVG